MSPAAGETQEPGQTSEEAPADGAGELEQLRQKLAEIDEKHARARQEIANYKNHLLNLNPIIEAGMKAQQQGAAQPTNSQQQNAAQQPLTAAQAEEIVSRKISEIWNQKTFETRQMEKLFSRAEKDFEDFDKMRDHPTYMGMVNYALYLQSDEGGALLQQQGDDPTYSAMQYAKDWFRASSPGFMKAVKETAKKEALDKAERKAVASAAGSTSKTVDVGGETKATQEQQEMVNILKGYRGGRRTLPSAR